MRSPTKTHGTILTAWGYALCGPSRTTVVSSSAGPAMVSTEAPAGSASPDASPAPSSPTHTEPPPPPWTRRRGSRCVPSEGGRGLVAAVLMLTLGVVICCWLLSLGCWVAAAFDAVIALVLFCCLLAWSA